MFLDEFMLQKSIEALVAATVIFYTKCLLVKAQHQKLKRNITPNFKDNGMALVLKVLHLACLP